MSQILNPNRAQEMIREKASAITDGTIEIRENILEAIDPGKNVDIVHLLLEMADRFTKPKCVYLHPTRNPEMGIAQAARHLWARTVVAEAIFDLLNQGRLLPMAAPVNLPALIISYSTKAENSGGQSADWDFQETAVCLPRFVQRRMRGDSRL